VIEMTTKILKFTGNTLLFVTAVGFLVIGTMLPIYIFIVGKSNMLYGG